jgi:hypothetical protein
MMQRLEPVIASAVTRIRPLGSLSKLTIDLGWYCGLLFYSIKKAVYSTM